MVPVSCLVVYVIFIILLQHYNYSWLLYIYYTTYLYDKALNINLLLVIVPPVGSTYHYNCWGMLSVDLILAFLLSHGPYQYTEHLLKLAACHPVSVPPLPEHLCLINTPFEA